MKKANRKRVKLVTLQLYEDCEPANGRSIDIPGAPALRMSFRVRPHFACHSDAAARCTHVILRPLVCSGRRISPFHPMGHRDFLRQAQDRVRCRALLRGARSLVVVLVLVTVRQRGAGFDDEDDDEDEPENVSLSPIILGPLQVGEACAEPVEGNLKPANAASVSLSLRNSALLMGGWFSVVVG